VLKLTILQQRQCFFALRRIRHEQFFATAQPLAPSCRRGSLRYFKKPRARRVVGADCPGLLGKNQERGLESIFNVRMVTKNATAHEPNERTMPLNDFGECRFIVVLGEPH
jgi:hypothetical protein